MKFKIEVDNKVSNLVQIGVTRPVSFKKLRVGNTLHTGKIYTVTLDEYVSLKTNPLYSKYVLDMDINKNSTRYLVWLITKKLV